MAEIRVPNIGDAENVEVIELCAVPGDVVGPDDAILVIESDKASMEVPAGIAGRLDELLVAVGDPVREGQPIARLSAPEEVPESHIDARPEPDGGAPADKPKPEAVQAAAAPASQPAPGTATSSAQSEIVVSVPDIGDARDVVVIELGIKPGDRVEQDVLAVVVESDKATMEIPAGAAGVVAAVHVAEGDPVVEGTRLFTLTGTHAPGQPSAGGPITDGDQEAEEGAAQGAPSPRGPEPAPVSGDRGTRPGQRGVRDGDAPEQVSSLGNRGTGTAAEARAPAPPPSATISTPQPGSPSPPLAPAKPPGSEIREEPSPGARVYAGPATRRLARELGVSLAEVDGTGGRGRIVKDDVKLFVKQAMTSPQGAGEPSGAGIPPVATVDFAKFGPVESVPLTRIRAAGARNLRASWLNIPQVTQHDAVDVTELQAFRRSLKPEAAERNIKLTPLPFVIKACCHALREFPTFNASLDAAASNYLLKRYYNIGFAVDSEQGLVVPVLKGAEGKGIWELAAEIAELADKVRDKRLSIDDTQGGTFSVSSLGTLGGTGFTPIVNAPEVAILGVARIATEPVWDGSQFQPRELLPLSLSYDHRAINGAEAGRFMRRIAELLTDIRRLSL